MSEHTELKEQSQAVVKAADSKSVAKPSPKTVREWVATDEFKKQVALSLPKHLTPDRFTRIALTAFNRTPKLADCTRESVFQCLLDLSALGLEPDGRRAHLIPFEDRKKNITVCTLIVDYKGLVDLVRRSGEVSDIHADVVCKNDDFSYCYGTGSHLKHKPVLEGRGEVIVAYSYVRLKDGSESFDVLSVQEINAVRDNSNGYRSAIKYGSDRHPWIANWNEMAKKTAFRRHSKWLPLSSELREKIEKDDELNEQARFDAARVVLPESEPRTTIVDIEEPAQ